MVSLQILSKVLNSKDFSIITDNMLNEDYFVDYKEEFLFIKEHYARYGNVPDKATFLSKFSNIELVDVTESDSYLINTVKEEYLYSKAVPVIQQAAKLLKSDSNVAAEYLIKELKNLQPNYDLKGQDIISTADERLEQYIQRKAHKEDYYFTTGFKELDDVIHGISRGEELIVLFARINQGKSWILEMMCTHVWQLGFNIGYISPEMSADSVGYRFDTLYKNFSNSSLVWGKDNLDESAYSDYIHKLKDNKNKFIVSTPTDFDKKITISKLRNYIKQYKLDLLAIDGITYLSDERAVRGDTKSTSLTNISEDLMSLSVELKIPILAVVQANRSGVATTEEDMPGLENIKDSDGIGANASKVLSIKQTKDGVFVIHIPKNRFGKAGGTLKYTWNIDTGEFAFLPSEEDFNKKEDNKPKLRVVKRKEDVF